jgi:hypothetical protein
MRWIPDWKGCKFSRVVETVGVDEFFKEFNKWYNMFHMCTLKMFIPLFGEAIHQQVPS